MKLTPLGDRVLIKVPEVKEVKTQSGLLLAGDAVEKPQEAEVVAVGKGRMLDNGEYVPMEIKVGDKVIYAKYGGTEVKIDEETYILMDAHDILAIVE
ncbi:MAG TPA: co-chaperone GroES [Firmicutes bacterium]|nr:co-chaperone GroES [Bacillota bacterium]